MKKSTAFISVLVVVSILALYFYLYAPNWGRTSYPYKYLKIFSEVLHFVEKKYVEKPDFNVLHKTALIGVAKRIGKNTSILFSTDDDRWKEPELYPQPGVRLYDRGSYFVVTSVFPRSPAEEAGLHPGIRIYEIGQHSAISMTLAQAYRALIGEEGSKVRMGLYDPDKDKPYYVEVGRVVLQPLTPTFEYDEQNNMGTIHLWTIDSVSVQMVRDTLKLWKVKGLRTLVLDLRECEGYHYKEAFELLDFFLSEGKSGVFLTRNGIIEQKSYTYSKHRSLITIHPAVFIDITTLGACELVASELKRTGSFIAGAPTGGGLFLYDTVPVRSRFSLWMPVASYSTSTKKEHIVKRVLPDRRYTDPKTDEKPLYLYKKDMIDWFYHELEQADRKVA